MQLTAKLSQLLPVQTGEGRNGPWKKQDIIVETDGQYPKKICISIWGDKINPDILTEGRDLDISFDIESREFNGKWYTNLKDWKIEAIGGQDAPPPHTDDDFVPPAETEDDLPF